MPRVSTRGNAPQAASNSSHVTHVSHVSHVTHVSAASQVPPGWTYNPSAWRERYPLLGLAVVGLLAALYTALSQLGVVAAMWDPLFGSASAYAVTHSAISRLLPVPDGVLGVVGYAGDLGFGTLGGEDRWHVRPWAVLAFALTITGLGIVSLALTILQGAYIGHWCTVCLVSAAVSLLIFGLGIGEALATLQALARVRASQGWASTWSAVWGRPRARGREQQRLPTGGVPAAG